MVALRPGAPAAAAAATTGVPRRNRDDPIPQTLERGKHEEQAGPSRVQAPPGTLQLAAAGDGRFCLQKRLPTGECPGLEPQLGALPSGTGFWPGHLLPTDNSSRGGAADSPFLQTGPPEGDELARVAEGTGFPPQEPRRSPQVKTGPTISPAEPHCWPAEAALGTGAEPTCSQEGKLRPEPRRDEEAQEAASETLPLSSPPTAASSKAPSSGSVQPPEGHPGKAEPSQAKFRPLPNMPKLVIPSAATKFPPEMTVTPPTPTLLSPEGSIAEETKQKLKSAILSAQSAANVRKESLCQPALEVLETSSQESSLESETDEDDDYMDI
ncbi:calcineurin-binding protein cabin-1-like [Symphalangus syndactylus]|uniref:calcineurin-binding protein cabin-1-like n=1 Tax=Symphalangus syndactylus TaxID=9590 RepID=UPI003004BD9B